MGSEAPRHIPKVTLAAHRILDGPGHVWIYAGHLHAVVGEPQAGDLVDVLNPNGRFYGRGFFNPNSKIRVRLVTFEDEPVDEAFWKKRVQQAIRLRERVVTQTNAYRLIYGEGDRLPGLIVDRYDRLLVMQTLSYGMDCRKDLLADVLMKELNAEAVYLRNDTKSRALEGLPLERRFLRGGGPTQVEIQEGSAKFLVRMVLRSTGKSAGRGQTRGRSRSIGSILPYRRVRHSCRARRSRVSGGSRCQSRHAGHGSNTRDDE
ncbi:MAG: hypothetical protein HP493_09800 [Nitrospira sp.]|nr:hypothetical protein [Nitrospira sp.]